MERGTQEQFCWIPCIGSKWCSHILDMGNSNSFCVEKDDKEIFRIPITLVVLLLLFAFWVVILTVYHWIIPEYAISFFRTGHACSRSGYFKAMDSAAETAENIKNGFSQAVSKDEK